MGNYAGLGIFFSKDGRALIVATDHGMIEDFRGLEHIEIIAKKVIDRGADALLVTPEMGKYLIKKIKDMMKNMLSMLSNLMQML